MYSTPVDFYHLVGGCDCSQAGGAASTGCRVVSSLLSRNAVAGVSSWTPASRQLAIASRTTTACTTDRYTFLIQLVHSPSQDGACLLAVDFIVLTRALVADGGVASSRWDGVRNCIVFSIQSAGLFFCWSRHWHLPLALSFYCAMLCIRGTSHGPVSVRVHHLCLSVHHKSVFYRNSWTNRAGFWHVSFLPPVLHCVIKEIRLSPKI